MKLRRVIVCVVTSPLFLSAGAAFAMDPLTDPQMDVVVAGAVTQIDCSSCIVASSSSASQNGVLVTMTDSRIVPTANSGGSGSTGDSGGSGNDGGTSDNSGTGGNNGANGSNSGSPFPTPPQVTVPQSFVTAIIQLSGFNPVAP